MQFKYALSKQELMGYFTEFGSFGANYVKVVVRQT